MTEAVGKPAGMGAVTANSKPEPAAGQPPLHLTTSATNEIPPRPESQPPPDLQEGGYGWVVIAAVFTLNAHTWGLNSSFAVFLAYYLRNDVFEGIGPLSYAFIGGLSISMALLLSPVTTTLVGWKKCGTQKTIFLGVILETVGFIGASFATKFWHLLLSQGFAFGFGMGLCFVASAPVPPQWFVKKRSFANAIGAAGSGAGGLCYSLATNAMISRLGLPWTFRVLAIICMVVNGICSFLIRDRNKDVGSVHLAFNWQLFRRPEFVLFEAWAFLSILGYTVLIFSIVDYCQVVGLSNSQASLVGALFNLGQAVGRPVIGLVSDRVGRMNISFLGTLLCGLFCLFFWTFGARTLASCIVFAILTGCVAGVVWTTVAPVCAEVVGLAMLPSALSMSWLVLVLPATFAEVIGLSIKGPGSWGYINNQVFTGLMYTGAFISGWFLRAWKIQEMEGRRLRKEQADPTSQGGDAVVSHAQPNPSRPERRALYLRSLWSITKV